MYEDPIVNEVRKTRERLMDEAGGYDAYIRKLIGMEEKHSERQVSHLPENLGRAIVITPPPDGCDYVFFVLLSAFVAWC